MSDELIKPFLDMRDNNVRLLEEAKDKGAKVVGMYCLYSPKEVAMAAGAITVSLCGTKQEPIPAAEKELPRNLCPLIKSSYGFAVSDSCPYFHHSDLVIAETTCDGKKKMYELMGKLKPLHLLQLPQKQDDPDAAAYWYSEVRKLKERIEKDFDLTISDEDLKKAIKLGNEERRSLKDFQDIGKIKPSPISGMDLLTVMNIRGFCSDKEEAIRQVDALTAKLKENAAQGISPFTEKTPRILITGVPVGVGSHKVVKLIEECGGNVVCLENCTGYKAVDDQIDEEKDPILAIAEKYLRVPCSCMSPNTNRFELVERIADEFAVDGIVDLTWQACHTYNVESYSLRKYLQEKKQRPFLQIETDYSESDAEQLKVRIEAFLEMLV